MIAKGPAKTDDKTTGPSTSSSKVKDPILDQDLFNLYGLPTNWDLAPELVTWLESICNKEVPNSVLKELNEAFIPKEDLQPLFAAPVLPKAINTSCSQLPNQFPRDPNLSTLHS